MDLQTIAHKFSTDKRAEDHNYVEFYDRIMGSTRENVKRILEIGIGHGASIRMWLEYFPNARIYAVDNYKPHIEFLMSQEFEGKDRIVMFEKDQCDKSIWDNLHDFDYVIDDGSHVPDDQIITFKNGFHVLRTGGLWFIEDTHCNFHPHFNPTGHDILYDWIFKLILSQQQLDIMAGNFYLARAKADIGAHTLPYQIFSFSFYKSMIILEKAHD